MEASYTIWSDIQKNRLYIVLKGSIPDDMAKAAADKVISEAGKLSSGFTVINDISDLAPASPAGVKEIKRAQAYLGFKGMKRIIRIIHPSKEDTKKQFENVSKKYPSTNTASSIVEAEKLLDN